MRLKVLDRGVSAFLPSRGSVNGQAVAFQSGEDAGNLRYWQSCEARQVTEAGRCAYRQRIEYEHLRQIQDVIITLILGGGGRRGWFGR